MTTKIPASYKDRDGCVNCKFSKILHQGYDDPECTFCVIDNPDVREDVIFTDSSEPEEEKNKKSDWFYSHIVSPAGICDKWEKKDEK